MTQESMVGKMEELGYRARIVPAGHLGALAAELKSRHTQGFFDEGFFTERLTGFNFSLPDALSEARSLIIAAYADPHVRFTFRWKGEVLRVLVPSTYLHWTEKDARAAKAFGELLEEEGYSLAEAKVPKKLLAVRSDLSRYGRNNITYAEGLGSFYRLTAFFSDLPCDSDPWREPALMERCEDCTACVRACPTGAIDPGRFLLRAERCISFWNEKPEGVSFPEWLKGTWHNCLVGCMHCQRVCPENARPEEVCEEGEEFSEDETRLLLEGRQTDRLPAELRRKLENADLLPALDTMPRNLGVLLKTRPLQG